MKFKLNKARTQNCQLNLLDAPVTLLEIYGQGHWKWYEQEKLIE